MEGNLQHLGRDKILPTGYGKQGWENLGNRHVKTEAVLFTNDVKQALQHALIVKQETTPFIISKYYNVKTWF